MRVGLDLTAAPPRLAGAGHYMVELVAALARRGRVDLELFARRDHHAVLARRAPAARIRGGAPGPRPLRLLWEQTRLPLSLRGVDVLHAPHYTMPLLARVPVVVTFHDATFFTHPELHEPAKVRFFRAAMRLSARRAARVVAVSETTRREILLHTPVDPERILVVHEGVDHERFHPPTDGEVEAFRRKHRAERPWIAFLGTLEPRKNVTRLVEAFTRMASDFPLDLLLGGQTGWASDVLEEALRAAPPGRVRRLGYLLDDELRSFLGGAEAVCYPSIAEGFGLPVVEAMACGVPVVTAGISATAEVAGDAAVLVDPFDVRSIEGGLRRVLGDADLRARLVAAGKARAATFTWDAAAEGMEQIYETLV